MLNTLRGRFILSHILPLLIVIPLMGIAIIYLVETQFLLPSMLAELKGDALLLSRIAAQDQELWHDPTYAQKLLSQASFRNDGRLMLLNSDGTLIASSDPADANRIGTPVEHPGLATAMQGQIVTQLRYSQAIGDDIADALARWTDTRLHSSVIPLLFLHRSTLPTALSVNWYPHRGLVAGHGPGSCSGRQCRRAGRAGD